MTVAGDTDGREECVGAWVIACGDASPVLELGEEVLDLMALAIERLAVSEGDFPTAARWNAGFDAFGDPRLAERGAIIAAVRDEGFGCGRAASTRLAPLWSLIWPSESSMMIGRPVSSQTVWSLESSPPLVRPIRRGRAPFEQARRRTVRLQMCGADHDPLRLRPRQARRRSGRGRRAGSS